MPCTARTFNIGRRVRHHHNIQVAKYVQDDVPLRLSMWGTNLFTQGHFDAYIVDYYDYRPVPAAAETWAVPDICPSQPEPENAATKRSHWLAEIRSVLPSTHFGEQCSRM